MATPKRKAKKSSATTQEHMQMQIFALSLNKLVTDYWTSRVFYRECAERFFEEWLLANFYTWTPAFERELLRAFVGMVLIRGRQKETK